MAHESVISGNSSVLQNYSSIEKAKAVYKQPKAGLPTSVDPKRATPKHRLADSMKGSLFQIINANSKVRSNSKPANSLHTAKSTNTIKKSYNTNINSHNSYNNSVRKPKSAINEEKIKQLENVLKEHINTIEDLKESLKINKDNL